MDIQVIPDRDCGTCNVCCVALTIDDPELRKVQGYRCQHLTSERSCGIYAARPETCRKFECGWRVLRWVKMSLRPDNSDILIRLQSGPDGELGIAVHFLSRAALNAEGLAETIAAAVNAGRRVHMIIPSRPGYTAATARIDEALSDAVASRDKAAVLSTLREAYRVGKRGKTVPIRFTDDGSVVTS